MQYNGGINGEQPFVFAAGDRLSVFFIHSLLFHKLLLMQYQNTVKLPLSSGEEIYLYPTHHHHFN